MEKVVLGDHPQEIPAFIAPRARRERMLVQEGPQGDTPPKAPY